VSPESIMIQKPLFLPQIITAISALLKQPLLVPKDPD